MSNFKNKSFKPVDGIVSHDAKSEALSLVRRDEKNPQTSMEHKNFTNLKSLYAIKLDRPSSSIGFRSFAGSRIKKPWDSNTSLIEKKETKRRPIKPSKAPEDSVIVQANVHEEWLEKMANKNIKKIEKLKLSAVKNRLHRPNSSIGFRSLSDNRINTKLDSSLSFIKPKEPKIQPSIDVSKCAIRLRPTSSVEFRPLGRPKSHLNESIENTKVPQDAVAILQANTDDRRYFSQKRSFKDRGSIREATEKEAQVLKAQNEEERKKITKQRKASDLANSKLTLQMLDEARKKVEPLIGNFVSLDAGKAEKSVSKASYKGAGQSIQALLDRKLGSIGRK